MKGAYFGWDIGGAHLKLACLDAQGHLLAVRQVACPLWQGLVQLHKAAADLGVADCPPQAVHAVTMTGELCDVFTDRESGVRDILGCLNDMLDGRGTVRVFAGAQGWLSLAEAGPAASAVASANWMALAHLVARQIEAGVLLDIGSTTTDVILIEQGVVRCVGSDDASRLASGELLYTGMVRTPLMAVRAVRVNTRVSVIAPTRGANSSHCFSTRETDTTSSFCFVVYVYSANTTYFLGPNKSVFGLMKKTG